MQQVECWCVFELEVPSTVNRPGIHTPVEGDAGKVTFLKGLRVIEAAVFTDSSGVGRVRFMPDEEGEWLYEMRSEFLDKGELRGRIQCTAPRLGNHGPVGVINEKDFSYADGTAYVPFGTTCLNGLQRDHLEQTLSTIVKAPFNKIRISVDIGLTDFEALEEGLVRLMEQGVEAELLLDCGDGGPEALSFLQQTTARLAAYRNVWWSLQIRGKDDSTGRNKAALLELMQNCDPYHHLLTVHTSNPLSDFGHRSITHVSLQSYDPSQISYYAKLHRKPIILDECGCEGDWPTLWGSLPAEEMVKRIWESVCRGGYAGHGEMFLQANGETWQNEGGTLLGAAVPRIAFLRGIMENAPLGLHYMPVFYDAATIGCEAEYYLQYFGIHRFPSKQLSLPEGRYSVEIIDTWNMTVTTLPDLYEEKVFVTLPTRPYHAMRVHRVGSHPLTTTMNSVLQEAEENDNFVVKTNKP